MTIFSTPAIISEQNVVANKSCQSGQENPGYSKRSFFLDFSKIRFYVLAS